MRREPVATKIPKDFLPTDHSYALVAKHGAIRETNRIKLGNEFLIAPPHNRLVYNPLPGYRNQH